MFLNEQEDQFFYLYFGIHALDFILTSLFNDCNICFQSKLDDYQARKNKGERLNQDQLVRWETGS